jgi:hypothetical protein
MFAHRRLDAAALEIRLRIKGKRGTHHPQTPLSASGIHRHILNKQNNMPFCGTYLPRTRT